MPKKVKQAYKSIKPFLSFMIERNPERYMVMNSKSERHRRSAVPYLQRLLNKDYLRQKKDLSKLFRVNNGVHYNTPIT